jgi:hypothetical protein
MMMDIRVNAQVECADGRCGHCAQIILNPRAEQVTHLVVRGDLSPESQRLVAMRHVLNTDSNLIRLRCTRTELEEMEDFVEREYVRVTVPPAFGPLEYSIEPRCDSPTTEVAIEHMRIPYGGIAVNRGVHVQAADGPIGQVNEFLVDSIDGHVTHLVLCEGHPWGKKPVMIPVWIIDHIEENVVYLRLTKRYLGALPTIRAREDSARKA